MVLSVALTTSLVLGLSPVLLAQLLGLRLSGVVTVLLICLCVCGVLELAGARLASQSHLLPEEW